MAPRTVTGAQLESSPPVSLSEALASGAHAKDLLGRLFGNSAAEDERNLRWNLVEIDHPTIVQSHFKLA